eukprot:jgi/Mesvir1/15654/Mv03259-RA.1
MLGVVRQKWEREQQQLKALLKTSDDVPWLASLHAARGSAARDGEPVPLDTGPTPAGSCEQLRLVGGLDISFAVTTDAPAWPDQGDPDQGGSCGHATNGMVQGASGVATQRHNQGASGGDGPSHGSHSSSHEGASHGDTPGGEQVASGGHPPATVACAALAVLSYPGLQLLHVVTRQLPITVPYLPGFLAFREAPAALALLQQLRNDRPDLFPQVVFVDGNGMLHPKGFGSACHIGVLADVPTIGIGKKLFHVDGLTKDIVRSRAVESNLAGGDAFPLVGDSGATWGMALRSNAACSPAKPLFVSVGHRLSLASALALTRACCRHRVPEPIRQADILSREFIRKLGLPGTHAREEEASDD